jgi:hypothetical protein
LIYYAIQAHQYTEAFEWLLKALTKDDAQIDISFDMSHQSVLEANEKLKGEFGNNFNVNQSQPVSWGGRTLTKEMLNALKRSLETPNWKWFINLSGACFPTKPSRDLFGYLEARRIENGLLGYCNAFQSKKEPLEIPYKAFAPDKQITYARVEFISDFELSEMIHNKQLDPARNVMHRSALRYVETGKNLFELHRRKSGEKKFPQKPWFGRQWVALHRSIVEQLVYSPNTYQVYQNLKECFISDESFFQELLFSDNASITSKISKSNLHFRGGGSKILDIEAVKQIEKSDIFFVRKVYPRQAKQLFEMAQGSAA